MYCKTTSISKIIVNGILYEGKTFDIAYGHVVIDGVTQAQTLGHVVNVEITGNCNVLENGAGDVTVSGDTQDVSTKAGDIQCGNVSGNVSAGCGNVTCGTVGGNVKASCGDVNCRK